MTAQRTARIQQGAGRQKGRHVAVMRLGERHVQLGSAVRRQVIGHPAAGLERRPSDLPDQFISRQPRRVNVQRSVQTGNGGLPVRQGKGGLP